ncbi:hypothetical protein HHTV1_60 [Haloarcula hispanica tailed virus 1]|uniref:Uncharacterized protein n=1 Tax=Haloarcula hispanica tailed virus 1 TaxID=1273750 RepID=R4T6I6_9CAUD|nr:hypothetical protein M198_gp60 [Haloarcula hispanica tailed virus 1]AGM11314.1 hypothetical protein HHTV1_60 [Haloarcula hispanica tailed virus 1]
MMNWQPTILVVLIYLAVLAIVIGGHRLLDHTIGISELKKRSSLIWMAARGKDYRVPDFHDMGVTHQEFDHPSQAEDPITAILVRSSEAERRWYSLHHLIDQWETEGKHQRMMQPQEERAIHDFLRQQHRQAIEEAKEQIRSRMELTHFTDEDGMAEKFIIQDPATDYRVQIRMSARDLVRHEPRPGGDLPPSVQQRMDSFPDQVLREVEQRSDTQHCWV